MVEYQEIYIHNCNVFWQTKRGKSFLNHRKGSQERPISIVTRAKNVLDINKSEATIEYIKKIMSLPKSVQNIRVIKIYNSKIISNSSHYKKTEYEKEFKTKH